MLRGCRSGSIARERIATRTRRRKVSSRLFLVSIRRRCLSWRFQREAPEPKRALRVCVFNPVCFFAFVFASTVCPLFFLFSLFSVFVFAFSPSVCVPCVSSFAACALASADAVPVGPSSS